SFSGLSRPISVVVDDFNHDGHQDVAFANYVDPNVSGNGTVQIFLGTGHGTFTTGASFNAGPFAFSLVSSDFNKDGKRDLAIGRNNSVDNSTLGVLLGNGDGTFQPSVDYVIHRTTSIVVGDFNSDGIQDLAAATLSSNNLDLLLGKGDGTFQP